MLYKSEWYLVTIRIDIEIASKQMLVLCKINDIED